MANLTDESISTLITFLKERPRATRHDNRTYIDTGNNLKLIILPRHTVVFGRRGSGKTMLLSELAKKAESNKQGVVWIDVDDYKTLTFPDILIQILRSLFKALAADVRKYVPWYALHRHIKNRKHLRGLRNEEKYLAGLLQRFEESDLHVDEQFGQKFFDNRDSGIKASKLLTAEIKDSRGSERSHSRAEMAAGRDRKIDHIERHLHDAKSLLADTLIVGSSTYFLILDDFYHLTIDDQAKVLDYLQSLSKNLNVHIKFGTIAHRSNLYSRGRGLIQGMQKEHDVLPIDLDRTFQNFQEVEQFIRHLWNQIRNIDDWLFGGDSWQQLILASGGVPRDFMNLLSRAIELGRAKGKDRLDVFLVNEAANLYLRETKHEDLISEKAEETGEIEQMLLDIRNFCTNERKRNLFLISKDDLESKPHQMEMLRQLLDYRFVHLVHSNTSVAGKAGRFEAYMLDVGLYAHPQRRGDNRVKQVDFLARDDQHRADAIRTQPIYTLKETYLPNGDSPFAPPTELEEAEITIKETTQQQANIDEPVQMFLQF